jgi:MazG family protein
MIRRHPHVFGSATAETSDEVLRNWEAIKRREKADAGVARAGGSVLDGIPTGLPALLKAQRLGDKAARIGFDWERAVDVIDKVEEEAGELRRAVAGGDRDAIREELGDLVFTLVMLARKSAIDPEGALEHANRKFADRFRRMEAELSRRGLDPARADLALLERLWEEGK